VSILIDDPIWSWRHERWAHLASDASVEELHEFAGRLGLRRLAFQGDHYDVPASLRDRALVLGAAPVSSRELVRRLRASGLRRRAGSVVWQRVLVADAAAMGEIDGLLAGAFEPPVAADLGEAIRAALGASAPEAMSIMGFVSAERAAVALELAGTWTIPPLDVAADEAHVTHRANTTLVELLVAR
jgi:Protein of unknown function (DUF4031)